MFVSEQITNAGHDVLVEDTLLKPCCRWIAGTSQVFAGLIE